MEGVRFVMQALKYKAGPLNFELRGFMLHVLLVDEGTPLVVLNCVEETGLGVDCRAGFISLRCTSTPPSAL